VDIIPEPVWILAGAALAVLALMALLSRPPRRPPTTKGPVWAEVARRLGGKLFVQDGVFRIRFKGQGREAALFQETPIRFEVRGEFGTFRIGLAGGPGVSAHSTSAALPELPEVRYEVTDEATARAFLTAPVRQLLRDLIALSANRVDVTFGVQMTVAGDVLQDPQALTRFSILCLQLAQHAKLFVEQSSGVRVLEERSSSTGQCQICGADLEGTLVRCVRCSTPHHADCWTYAGACSTYGCGEKKFVT